MANPNSSSPKSHSAGDPALLVPGVVTVEASAAAPDGLVYVGAASGWIARSSIMEWAQELTVVRRQDLSEKICQELGLKLPAAVVPGEQYPWCQRAASAASLVAVEAEIADKLVAQGIRTHSIGVDRVSGGFFYIAEGGGQDKVRVQGDVYGAVAEAMDLLQDDGALDACLDGLLDRLLTKFSDGVVSALELELAAALPPVSLSSADLGELAEMEALLAENAAKSEKLIQSAERLTTLLTGALEDAPEDIAVPLYGQARRQIQPELPVELMLGDEGLPQKTVLPARHRWRVSGTPQEEAATTEAAAPEEAATAQKAPPKAEVKPAVDAKAEAKKKAAAEAKAKAEAEAKKKAAAEAKAKAEAEAKRKAEAKAKAEAEAKKKAEAKAKAAAEAKKKAAAEAKAKAEAEARKKAEAEAKAKAEAEARKKAEAEAKAKAQAEADSVSVSRVVDVAGTPSAASAGEAKASESKVAQAEPAAAPAAGPEQTAGQQPANPQSSRKQSAGQGKGGGKKARAKGKGKKGKKKRGSTAPSSPPKAREAAPHKAREAAAGRQQRSAPSEASVPSRGLPPLVLVLLMLAAMGIAGVAAFMWLS